MGAGASSSQPLQQICNQIAKAVPQFESTIHIATTQPAPAVSTTASGSREPLNISRTQGQLISNANYLINRNVLQRAGSDPDKDIQLGIPIVCLFFNKLLLYHEVEGNRYTEQQRSFVTFKIYSMLEAEREKRQVSERNFHISVEEFHFMLCNFDDLEACTNSLGFK